MTTRIDPRHQAPLPTHVSTHLGQGDNPLDSHVDAVLIKYREGRLAYCNAAAIRLANRTLEELSREVHVRLFNEWSEESTLAAEKQVLETGLAITEDKDARIDGVRHLFSVTLSPHRDPAGNSIGVAYVARDVTAQRRTERALVQQQLILERITRGARLAEILHLIVSTVEGEIEGSTCEFMLVDQDGKHLRVAACDGHRRAYCDAIDGVPIDPELGPCAHAVFYEEMVVVEDIERLDKWSFFRQLSLAHGFRSCFSFPLVSRFGPSPTVLGTCAVYFSSPTKMNDQIAEIVERTAYLACISIENTLAKEALQTGQRIVQASEQRLRSLITTLAEGVVYQAADGLITLCNATAENILGVPEEQILGKPFIHPHWQVLHEDGTPFLAENNPVFVTRQTGQPQTRVVMGVTKPDASITWIEVNSQPLLGETESSPFAVVCSFSDITTRKQTADLLRTSESRLAEAQRIARIGSWTWSADTNVVWWSDAIHELFGTDPSTTTPSFEAFLSLLHPDDRQTAIDRVKSMENGGSTFDDDLRLIRPSGEMLWINSRAKTTFDHSGNLLYVEGTDQDITARKRAQHLLSIQHHVVEILADANDMKEATRRVLKALAEPTCWDVAELWELSDEGSTVCLAGYWQGDDLPNLEKLASSHRKRPFPKYDPKRDASPFAAPWITMESEWFTDLQKESPDEDVDRYSSAGLRSAFVFPIVSGREALGMILLFSRCKREREDDAVAVYEQLGLQIGQFMVRKNAEGRLRLFRMLIDRTSDMIEVVDPESGRIVDVNQRACDAHGYQRDEYMRLNVADLDTKLLKQKPWSEIVLQMREARNMTIESVHRRKDGSEFPVEVNANLIQLDREYFVTVVRDITKRKLIEEQIRQSQKMDAVGRLAGGIAHDFNNLLTVINCQTELLLMNTDNGSSLREHFKAIQHAGKRAAELTSQLLTFSRNSTGELKTVSLNEIIEAASVMLSSLIREDISLKTELDSTVSPIDADPAQIERILVNLAVNARDAMQDGGELTIKTYNVVDDGPSSESVTVARGPHVCLEVSDTGCGIPEEIQANIFEPFFTTKEVGKGTGLGLPVVHGIMKQCGGEVTVESTPRQGTVFRLKFPVSSQTPVRPATASSPGQQVRDATVLVVDDEEGIRNAIRIVLESQGLQVLLAERGAKALELMRDHEGPIDLLVTDVVMPDMGGIELINIVRSFNPSLKMILMSGYAEGPASELAVNDANLLFLDKPFSPMDLIEAISGCLGSPSSS